MPQRKPYDAIIIGGGHDGLTCACYLAAAGYKVIVLERREVVGGAAITEEFFPGFRNSAADLVIDTVTRYAPNFKASVLGRKIYSPLDLEREFGLTRGDIFHGALTADQIWSARPVLGHANYRAPVKGLYLSGAGTHPGGGVSGLPGHNAAREVLRDIRKLARDRERNARA